METQPKAGSARTEGCALPEIHVMPYTHADIAWVHTRAWHIDRYVRVMDEVLALMEADPGYHYYVDTWIELMQPYLAHRPDAREAIRRYIREGRLAVCGGQFGNVRSTAVGDETQVRNLQLGLKRWREVAPEVDPRVHSNIDVTFGHSQMPQLLRLAGMEAYFVMRPLAALDAQGIPRCFVWQGLSGDRIIMYRDTGVGLFQEHERHGPTWEADWPSVREHLWKAHLGAPAEVGTKAIGLTVGVDDSRPERFAFNDVAAGYAELIDAWNRRENGPMRYGTPDTLLAAIRDDEASLQVVEGALEPTDVHFNIALHGRRGIWWLREQADRHLVTAEIIASLARLAGPDPSESPVFPESELNGLWEQLLSWTPHAVQWLFREDWAKGEAVLRGVASAADRIARTACSSLVGETLPLDSDGLACVNPLPSAERCVTPLWVINTDLTRGFAGLTKQDGSSVPVQVVDTPVAAAEVSLLAEIDAPGCGVTMFETRWEPAPSGLSYPEAEAYWRKRYGLVDRRPIDDGCIAIESDCVHMTLSGGHVTSVQGVASGRETTHIAPEGASYLEPVCYAIQRTGWHTDSVGDEPARLAVERVRLDENGPLRWRVTREGHAGGFWVRQHLDLLKGDRAVRSITQFMDPADEQDALIAVTVPIAVGSRIEVDIPFGVETRPVGQIRYGISERAIPGLIWGRTWARAVSEEHALALVAEDGDKLFRVHGSPTRLAHLMAQKTRVFEDGWTAYIDTHDVGGRQVFHHVLTLDSSAERQALMSRAQRARHPLVVVPARRESIGADITLLSIVPATVRLSALLWEAGDIVVRLVQMASESAAATVTLPFEIAEASAEDLRGRRRNAAVSVQGRDLRLPLGPWEIATLRIRPGVAAPGGAGGRAS